jgi:hypothetical protein
MLIGSLTIAPCRQAINMFIWFVRKTTLELPDELFRSVKALAAQQGTSLKELVADALREKLARTSNAVEEKPWRKHFGALAHLRKETRRIEQLIEREFETVEDSDDS